MKIVVWPVMAKRLFGFPHYPKLNVMVDEDAIPIKVIRYLVYRNDKDFPYSFTKKEDAENFFHKVDK